jgi:flavin-binding protein dodecin
VSDPVYKSIELTGSSRTSIEEAVNNALAKAAKTLHNLRWFQVVETRGQIGFTLDD